MTLGLLPPVAAYAANEAAGNAAGHAKPTKGIKAPAARLRKPAANAKPAAPTPTPSAKLITDVVKKAHLETDQHGIALRVVSATFAGAPVVPGNDLPDNQWQLEVMGGEPQESVGQERERPLVGQRQEVLGGKPAAVVDARIGILGKQPQRVVDSVLVPLVTSAESPDSRQPPDSLIDVVAVGGEARFHCTGIAVAPLAVLTARHCLPATRVLFGSHVDHPIALRAVTASVASAGTNDIAVLWLASPVTVRLRRWHAAQDGEPALLGRIVGFGANDSAATRGAGEKRAARIPLQGWGCDLSRARTVGCQTGQELVVATPGGVDTCDGDSGGPLFERVSGEWRLLGITSRPIASARKTCGDGGIYTRIDAVTDWVRGVLRAGPEKSKP